MKKLWPIPLFLLGVLSICAVWTYGPQLLGELQHNFSTSQPSGEALSPLAKLVLLTACGIVATALVAVLVVLVVKTARKYIGKVGASGGINACVDWIKTGWGVITIVLAGAFLLWWVSNVPGWEWLKNISTAMWFVLGALILANIVWPHKGWKTEGWRKFSAVALLLLVLGGTAWHKQVEIRAGINDLWPKSTPPLPAGSTNVTVNVVPPILEIAPLPRVGSKKILAPTGRQWSTEKFQVTTRKFSIKPSGPVLLRNTKTGKTYLDRPGEPSSMVIPFYENEFEFQSVTNETVEVICEWWE